MKIFVIALFGFAIAAFCELFHRYRKLAWLILAVLPPLLTPLWLKYPHNPFIWAKLYSIIAISLAVLAYALPKLAKIKRYYLVILAFIFLNIVEAVVQNFSTGLKLHSWPHFMNALAGMLILVALPYKNFIGIERTRGRTLLLCDFHWGIVVCYSIWNTLFVYLEWPEFIGLQIMLMLVPISFMIIDRRLWVEARVYSLSLYLMVHFTWPNFVDSLNLFYPTSLALSWGFATLSLLSCVALVWSLKVKTH